MTRFAISVLRLGLCCLGAGFFAFGLTGFVMGDAIHSAAPDTDPVMLRLADALMLLYGLILLLHWRLLASALPLAVLLVGSVVALATRIFCHNAPGPDLLSRMFRFLLALTPLALALVFVAWDHRNLTSVRS